MKTEGDLQGPSGAPSAVDVAGLSDASVRAATRIQSVSRAIALLKLASLSNGGITADEGARHLNVSLATAYHLLNTLSDEGVLAKSQRRFHLGPAVGQIADAYLRFNATPPHLLEPLGRLARDTGETASLCTWRHGEIIEVAAIEGTKPLRVGRATSGPQPHPHARASGKLLLAGMSERELDEYLHAHRLVGLTPRTIVDAEFLREELRVTRERGWAMEIEECDEGVACLAVPVAGDTNGGVVAYTIGAPAFRLSESRQEYLGALMAAAAEARLMGTGR